MTRISNNGNSFNMPMSWLNAQSNISAPMDMMLATMNNFLGGMGQSSASGSEGPSGAEGFSRSENVPPPEILSSEPTSSQLSPTRFNLSAMSNGFWANNVGPNVQQMFRDGSGMA